MNREQYANGFSVKYDFDQYSRIKTISDYSTGSKIYEINSYNHLDQALTDTRYCNNNIQSNYTYDKFGRTTKQWNNFYNYSYQYNSNSHNLRSFNNNSVKEYYEYDKDRLKSYGPLTSNNSGALNFAPNGNITLNPAITPDAQDNNITYNPFPNSISTIPLSENQPYLPTNQTIEYTPFNKVSSITDGDYNFRFQYNSNHERVKMEVENDNETMMTKYYFGPSEIQETSEGTRTINHIGIGTGLLAMHVTHPDGSTEIIQCFTDRLGSPIVLANENGHEIGRYSYTPWGKQRDPYSLQTISFSNQPVSWFHRGYTGHEMLYGIGIINMNGRIYDPHTHQFLSPDNYIQAPGFSQSYNRFAYCVNNPLMYTDPSGEIIFTIIGAIFAPVTGGASLALGIAMDVGGAINLGIKASQGKINSVGDGFAAYGIGAAAGAAGYFTGGAAFAAAGGAAGGAGGFLAGAAAGAAGSAASMPIQSLGNTLYFGDPFITPEQYALGIVTGAALGGTINGGIALKNGRGFWNGSVKPSNIGTPTPTLQIDQPEVKLNTDGMRTQPKPMPDNNRFTVSTRQQDITYTTTDGVKITMSRPDIKGYHPSLAGKTDLYHNYPLSLDKPIIQGGDWAQRVVDGAAWFQAPGTINGTQGMYQIGVNSNGIIFHRVFVPF